MHPQQCTSRSLRVTFCSPRLQLRLPPPSPGLPACCRLAAGPIRPEPLPLPDPSRRHPSALHSFAYSYLCGRSAANQRARRPAQLLPPTPRRWHSRRDTPGGRVSSQRTAGSSCHLPRGRGERSDSRRQPEGLAAPACPPARGSPVLAPRRRALARWFAGASPAPRTACAPSTCSTR